MRSRLVKSLFSIPLLVGFAGAPYAPGAVAAMATMDYVMGLRKYWEKEMKKKDKKKK